VPVVEGAIVTLPAAATPEGVPPRISTRPPAFVPLVGLPPMSRSVPPAPAKLRPLRRTGVPGAVLLSVMDVPPVFHTGTVFAVPVPATGATDQVRTDSGAVTDDTLKY
jgi:hypothetical protein